MLKIINYISILIFLVVLFVGCSDSTKSSMTGIYLKAANGDNIILSEDNGAICMVSNTENKNIFDGLCNGDKIEISYGSICETYPSKTEVYSCKLIKHGNIEDIPNKDLENLNEMGWNFN